MLRVGLPVLGQWGSVVDWAGPVWFWGRPTLSVFLLVGEKGEAARQGGAARH